MTFGSYCLKVVPAGDVEALGIMLRRMDVDILITGYTHKFQVPHRSPIDNGKPYSIYCLEFMMWTWNHPSLFVLTETEK